MLAILGLVVAAGLQLKIDSPQRELLVGEPLKLTVRWTAAARLGGVAVETTDFEYQSLRFVVDDGAGPRTYREFPHDSGDRLLVLHAMAAGEKRALNHALVRGGYESGARTVPGFLFPARGRYSLKAVYVGDRSGVKIESNTLVFSVDVPGTVDDNAVWAQVQVTPDIRWLGGNAEEQAAGRRLITLHPRSAYLRLARLRLLERRANDLQNRFDPDTREPVFHLKGSALEHFRSERLRTMAVDILAADWGQFEEEALAFALRCAEVGGDAARASEARRRLFERYPRSVTVQAIRASDAEADE